MRKYLGTEPYFLANYADVLTDAPLDEMIARTVSGGALASMLVVPAPSSFHCVNVTSTAEVKEVMSLTDISVGVNGGYFVLHQDVIDLIPENGDLVGDECEALAGDGQADRAPPPGLLETGRHLQGTSRTRHRLQERDPAPGRCGNQAGRWRDRYRADDPRHVHRGGRGCEAFWVESVKLRTQR